MITYTKDKIIADNQEWITKSVNIDELLWAVKGNMKDDFETFYSLN